MLMSVDDDDDYYDDVVVLKVGHAFLLEGDSLTESSARINEPKAYYNLVSLALMHWSSKYILNTYLISRLIYLHHQSIRLSCKRSSTVSNFEYGRGEVTLALVPS